MIPRRARLPDASNARVAAYESLLDLLTLISFLLILAAFLYVARASAGDRNWASVSARVAQRGSGTPRAIPRNAFLIVLSRENSTNRMNAMSGVSGFKTNLVVSPETVGSALAGFSNELAHVSINLSVYEPTKEKVDPGVFLEVQRWLTYHQFNDWQLYFAP
jgi:hypothetical protein